VGFRRIPDPPGNPADLDHAVPVPDTPCAAVHAEQQTAVEAVRVLAVQAMAAQRGNRPLADLCLDIINRLRGL
jgi:hypothetical protein